MTRHTHFSPPVETPQLGLLDEPHVVFRGATYSEPQDRERLATALQKIRRALETGRSFTLAELATIGGCSEAGASARIRQCRCPKERGGLGMAIQSSRVKGGLWKYEAVKP